MLGLLFNPLRLITGPLSCIATVATLCCICRCVKCCRRWQYRDCALLKRFFLLTGHDGFDDFELMVLVHEALFDGSAAAKLSTAVRVTAGDESVKTDIHSNGTFQQPLHVIVEQGVEQVTIELLDSREAILASLVLETVEHLLNAENLQPERVYPMQQKRQGGLAGVRNAKVKLSMRVYMGDDTEKGSAAITSDVGVLVQQQLEKAEKVGGGGGQSLSEMEVLKNACAGPLEIFEGMGETQSTYMAVLGPPYSRRWALGLWKGQSDYEAKKHSVQEVDVMKIRSVQADPKRHHIFSINFYDENRVSQTLTFRRTDRARDVWVEILHLLVTKVRACKGGSKLPLNNSSGDAHASESSTRRNVASFEEGGW